MGKLTLEQQELADSLGPFKFHIWKQENYSGEHREWKEEYTLPKGATLTRDIVEAVFNTDRCVLLGDNVTTKASAIEAIQTMLERGRVTLDPEGWLVLVPNAKVPNSLGELENGLPDLIEIYRAIKRSGSRSHAGIAKAIDEALEPYRQALADLRKPTQKCEHTDEIAQHTGDGTEVAFCPACGRNRVAPT